VLNFCGDGVKDVDRLITDILAARVGVDDNILAGRDGALAATVLRAVQAVGDGQNVGAVRRRAESPVRLLGRLIGGVQGDGFARTGRPLGDLIGHHLVGDLRAREGYNCLPSDREIGIAVQHLVLHADRARMAKHQQLGDFKGADTGLVLFVHEHRLVVEGATSAATADR